LVRFRAFANECTSSVAPDYDSIECGARVVKVFTLPAIPDTARAWSAHGWSSSPSGWSNTCADPTWIVHSRPGPEGFSPDLQICLPYRDFSIWHAGGDDVVSGANQMLFVVGGEHYRGGEPLPGGYAPRGRWSQSP